MLLGIGDLYGLLVTHMPVTWGNLWHAAWTERQ